MCDLTTATFKQESTILYGSERLGENKETRVLENVNYL